MERFFPWLESVPCKEVIWIAGNHDFALESPLPPSGRSRVHYLEDSGLTVHGLKFWGSPWVKPVGEGSWAFSIGEHIEAEEVDAGYLPALARSDSGRVVTMREHSRQNGGNLAQVFARIPEDIDVLITHSPPRGVCDDGVYPFERQHYGSQVLRERIEQIQPKLHICGHIHEGYGQGRIGQTTVANVARMDAFYRPLNPVMTFDIQPKEDK